MSSSQQQTQSSTNTQPWSAQIPYLQQAFGSAANALNTAQNTSTAQPTQFVAGLTPQQLETFNAMVGYGNGNNAATTQQGAGNSAITTGQGATNQAASNMANFNPNAINSVQNAINGANQYVQGVNIPGQVQAAMQNAINTANQVQLPGIARNAAATGNTGSSANGVAQGLVQSNLANQAGNLSAELSNQAYNTGAGLSSAIDQANLAATQGNNQALAQLGGSNESLGLGALSSAVGNQNSLYNTAAQGGLGLQQGNQANNANQLQAWNFSQSSPFTALQNFYNIIGSGQWGGQSQGNSTTTSTPSMLNTIGGILGAAGAIF